MTIKSAILSTALYLALNIAKSQSIYKQPVRSVDDNAIDMSQYVSKPILFIIVPSKSSDSIYNDHLDQLVFFQQRYGDTIQIIGILSNEDGYKFADRKVIQRSYEERKINIKLTEGMFTKKKNDSQSALMQWLTDKNKNHRNNYDAKGGGHKFLVNETGKLVAVLPPGASLLDNRVDNVINENLIIYQARNQK